MKNALIVIVAAVLLLGVTGCGSIPATHDTVTPQKTEFSITADAIYQANLANAHNIATGINAYNAINPDSALPDDVTLEQAKQALDAFWPDGLTDKQTETAWEKIEIKNGEASVKE